MRKSWYVFFDQLPGLPVRAVRPVADVLKAS